jgi:hypothetical protein
MGQEPPPTHEEALDDEHIFIRRAYLHLSNRFLGVFHLLKTTSREIFLRHTTQATVIQRVLSAISASSSSI